MTKMLIFKIAGFALVSIVAVIGLKTVFLVSANETALESSAVYFEENLGQHDAAVKFAVRGSAGNSVFLTGHDAVFVTVDNVSQRPFEDERSESHNAGSRNIDPPQKAVAVYMTLAGAESAAEPRGSGMLEHRTNYMIGEAANHRTDIANYREVRSSDIYPGVDLTWRGTTDGILEPLITADSEEALSQVEWNVSGADSVSLAGDGGVVFSTGIATVKVASPVVVVRGSDFTNERHTSFEVASSGRLKVSIGGFSRSRPMHSTGPDLAPGLSYSTFLGTNTRDDGNGIAVDALGQVYITGLTFSTAFPTTPGPYNPSNSGSFDMFVTKFNSAGSGLIYSTYLGGNSDDYGATIAVDAAGNAFVAGHGRSSNYPTTAGAFDNTPNGNYDILFSKLNSTGNALVYSTYIGGSGVEFVNPGSIEINSAGNAYLTGETDSANFPTTPGAYDTSVGGTDGFVLKFDVSGSSLEYSTYLGGSGTDRGVAIAVDASGNAHVTGIAGNGTFPTTAGAFQTTFGGGFDSFVTKFNPTGTALVYSTFLGGAGDELGTDIVINSAGQPILTGRVSSISTTFPRTAGAYQTSFAGNNDVFITEFNAAGNAVTYSTLFGGTLNETGEAIALLADGSVLIAGSTGSASLPTTPGAYDSTWNGNSDVFLARFRLEGNSTSDLTYSTFLGGGNNDFPRGVAVDAAGDVYVAGTAQSTFPTTSGAFSTIYNGGDWDAFVSKLELTPTPAFVEFSSATYIEDESQVAAITIIRGGDESIPVTVDFATIAGGSATGGASCALGVDYISLTQPVSFAATETEKTVNVTLCSDKFADPNETVNLALLNPVGGNLGTQNTSVLTINDTASQYRSTTPIDIVPVAPADPYPSTITVSGATSAAGSIRVTLYDVWHDHPDNIDVLLVSPTGAEYILMADAGGSTPIPETSARTLTFADSATQVLPDSGALMTGSHLPTSCETPVLSFAAPAPSGPYIEPGCLIARPAGNTLQGALGTPNPNGNWSLYVRDDGGLPRMFLSYGPMGQIAGGWGLEFLAPSSAGVEIIGRVLTNDGRGIRNAVVTLTDASGNQRRAYTSSFGYYRFDGVAAGATYVVSAAFRNYVFEPRVIQVFDPIADLDLVALPDQ